MSQTNKELEKFRRWVLEKDILTLNIDNYDKQFQLECKKTNLNCLSEFKKITEFIIRWKKNPDIIFNTDEIKVEFINLYIKIVLEINDFNNYELVPIIYNEELPLLYVVDLKLNIINAELLKRGKKKFNKEK